MLNQSPSPAPSIADMLEGLLGQSVSSASSTLSQSVHSIAEASIAEALDDDTVVEWSEEDVVFLHWRLLRELSGLSDPETPLEEKLNVLHWVFTEHDKESRPFSFANCLRIVGGSPLSPAPHFGSVDVEEIRGWIRYHVKAWLHATVERYPSWVREAVFRNPE
ncbi:MAG: hypothetical protein JWN13_3045, partial [Betaproteobacteria bacterium]|nr:hypothetical protein [Betaproteobacteria bacterium]